jgi:hypothetical protein
LDLSFEEPNVLGYRERTSYAPAAIAFGMICSFNSGEHFKVNPQRLQRIRKLLPSGITGMKNKVNQRFDSMAVNTVARLQLEQGYWICLIGFDFVRTPKRNNMPMLLARYSDPIRLAR